MLTEDDRTRIKLEEIYRSEVRAGLQRDEAPRSKAEAIVAFFQTNLGIWLLTSIVLAGLVSGWSALAAGWQARAGQAEAIERLDLEASYRLGRLQVDLYQLADHARGNTVLRYGEVPAAVESLIVSLQLPPAAGRPYLYPQYRDYSLPAVIAELRRLVPKGEQAELKQAIADVTGGLVMLEVEHASTSNPLSVATAVNRRLRISRWRATDFYFLDCAFC